MPYLRILGIFIVVIVVVIFNSIFIPIFGLYGAALGTGLCFVASIYYFKYLSKNYLGLKLK